MNPRAPHSPASASANLFGSLPSRFPYITVMAQSQFLTFITDEARRHPSFKLIMSARVDGLIQEDGVVRYTGQGAYAAQRDVRDTIAPMGVGSVIGAIIGGLLVGLVPSALLKGGLGIILIWSASRIFRHRQHAPPKL